AEDGIRDFHVTGVQTCAFRSEVLAPERRVGHLLGIRFPGGLPPDLAQRLDAARVHVSIRGDAVRVSPHLYNDEQDVARFLEVLRSEERRVGKAGRWRGRSCDE